MDKIKHKAMNREIKFRAWDKEDNRMIVDSQEFIPVIVTSYGVFRLSPHFTGNFYSLMPQERFDLMQYTGLKDKNGKEIYEGDIVTGIRRNDGRSYTGQIALPKSCWCLVYTVHDGKHSRSYRTANFKELKTIGNIYENPELLEQ